MNPVKTGVGALLAFFMLLLLIAAASDVVPQPSAADAIPDDPPESVGQALWEDRAMDIMFQMAIVLAGALGVLALVREVRGRD
jgi:hypothetical protein